MKKRLLALVAGLLTALAFASVAGASPVLFYEPPVPESLDP